MRILLFIRTLNRYRTLLLDKVWQQLVQHRVFILILVFIPLTFEVDDILGIYRRQTRLVDDTFELLLEFGVSFQGFPIALKEPMTLESCRNPLRIGRYKTFNSRARQLLVTAVRLLDASLQLAEVV